jgi:hypothetical protein
MEQTANLGREAEVVLGRLQAALRGLIAATPGVTDRPTDLKGTLGISYTLAWQMHKVANAAEVISEAGHLPGTAATERFLQAAAKRGAPAKRVMAVREARAAYEQLVTDHAHSRDEFDSIISGLSEEGLEQVDLTHRRAAFKAQSHYIGLQADTHLSTFIFRPSDSDPTMLDLAGFRGMIGLRRSRRDAKWIITSTKAVNDDGSVRKIPMTEPLAPAEEAREVGLLPRFCSVPSPMLRQVKTASGFVNTEVEPNGLGAQSAVTCLVGHVFRNVFVRYRDNVHKQQGGRTLVRTPCKALIHDILVQRGTFGDAEPTLDVFTDHRQIDPAEPDRECDRLALREKVIYLGRGASVLATTEVPRYEELAKYVFDRLTWDADEFDVYRCRVEYPMMPSSVKVMFDLPE